jgi:hypothetical protein
MALNNTPTAPARHYRPQSERQRREVLRRIDAAERESLAGDPYLLNAHPTPARPAPAPLRLIKMEPEPAICGAGRCSLNPACTRRCRYLQAQQAFASAPARRPQPGEIVMVEPTEAQIDHRLRRSVVIGLLVYSVSLLGFLAWLATS